MSLPLSPPIAPQLARGNDELPVGEGWSYEPKLDGFRAIAFVDGNAVHLLSRGGKALERYFPEITLPHGQYVLDGELIIDAASGAAEAEDFDALTARIHPAASRIERLSQRPQPGTWPSICSPIRRAAGWRPRSLSVAPASLRSWGSLRSRPRRWASRSWATGRLARVSP